MRTAALFITYYGSVFYSLVNPLFGLLFFVHITIFRPEALVWGSLAFGRLHLITALSVLSGLILRNGLFSSNTLTHTFQRTNVAIFLAFLTWLFIVSFSAEVSVQLSLDKSVDVLKIFLLCFLFSKIIRTEYELNAYAWVVAVSFGLLSFWGAAQGMAGNPRLDTLWPGGSNYIGAQLALVAPLVFAMATDGRLSLKSRLILYVCFASIILCCVYTDSRGAFLGLGTGMLILILGTQQRVRILVTGVLLAIVISPWIPDEYQQRVKSIFVEEESRDESSASRTILWQIALRIWQDHPIAGVGLENFSPVKEGYAERVGDIVTSEEMSRLIFGRQRYPHGMYTGLLAETGLVGTILLTVLLLRNIFCRLPRGLSNTLYFQAKGAKAGLIGFAIAAVFGDFQYVELLYLQLFFLGAIRAMTNPSTNQVAEQAPGWRKAESFPHARVSTGPA
jgi:O-antigen ligase